MSKTRDRANVLDGWAVAFVATASAVILTSATPSVTESKPSSGQLLMGNTTAQTEWTLLYTEDFSTPLNDAVAPWIWDAYSAPFDTITDDSGQWYRNDYGPAWDAALNSFATYRKEFPVGQDGWLTASLSARDWDKDGAIEAPPSISTKVQGEGHVAVLDVPDHTGGAILRSTNQLPSQYRIEYKLKTINFGGKRDGALEYDNRINGYSKDGCKTQHPWGEGSNTPGWTGDASVPYCEWQGVREGPYGYNGFHFLSIVDFPDPVPRNNHFWHYHRKVLIDSFSQHQDRVGSGTGGLICDPSTTHYYNYRNSSFNTVNMWISGLPDWNPDPGRLPGNSQWFMTSCSDGIATQQLSSAAELQPELMPNEFYTFAIERDLTGYTLEATGNFARGGQQTLRFHRPFVVNNIPIWHYNSVGSEYDGRFNADLVQNDAYASTTWTNQWPAGSAYPDYFLIGDPYTNVYEGSASLTDIRLYVPNMGNREDSPNLPGDIISLKTSAPVPQSPAFNTETEGMTPTLIAENSQPTYVSSADLIYDFEIYKVANVGGMTKVGPTRSVTQTLTVTSYTVPTGDLVKSSKYAWRTRARIGTDHGPWSNTATFRTPTVVTLPAPSLRP
ncbi:MAG: mucin-5B [Acidobacteriota bacterium]|nr:mucin-5B [Acidobacteriota bacterium]